MNKSLKIAFSAVLPAVLLAATLTPMAWAEQATPSSSSTARPNQANRISLIKSRSDLEIGNRLTSLNAALIRINAATKLSANDKSKFSSEVQADITNLTALKSKIDADTDLTSLMTDAKTIFTDFRVYAIFLPQVHMLAAVDAMGVTADNLSAIAGKLQTRIQSAQSQGKNVTGLQTLLADMNSKIADAKLQYSAVESEIAPLTPANYPAVATFQDARNKIKTGSADLRAALNDARQIVQALKSMNTTSTSTGSATVTQ